MSTPPLQNGAVAERSTGYWVRTLLILLLLTEQSALGFSLIAPALPKVAAEFQTTQVVWVMTAFTLAGAVASPIIGKLADTYGKKRMLVITAAIGSIGALISATATVFPLMVVGRFLSGAAFACMALGYTLIRDVFPERLRALSISIANTGVGAVGVGSMLVAGVLIDHLGVRSVFWFAFAFCGLGAILTALLVPETPVRAHSRIDWTGAVLLAVSMFIVMLGLSKGKEWGLGDAKTLGCVGVALVGFAIWVWWERRTPEPLIQLDLIAEPTLRYTLIGGGLAYGSTTLLATLMPMLLQAPESTGYGFGLTATQMAGWLLPGQLAIVASGFIVGATAVWLGFRRHLIIGALLLALSAVLLSTVPTVPAVAIAIWVVFGFGCMIYAAVPNLALTALPETQRAVGANFVGVAQTLCGTLISTIGFTVLANYVVAAEGYGVVYSEAGFRGAFLVAAGFAFVGGLIAFAVPKVRAARSDDPDSQTADSPSAV
ncbi:MFS transporter [Gordonia neofelifaecis]|uniref:Mfs transporter n=1 Tax=Gordonia neofelifaecis NRRL B-59395 TaxID=644548 RepID=F1YPH6_9ACTN|nr:MFS transporter [Gordonia neofelifaecis]EGD53427.1 mfs transporter [Gordonia neofelifaecis NRRL B-59395]